MRAELLLVLLAGCTGVNPVEDCPFYPETDCCKNSSQCFEFYDEFPYCNRPNQKNGGICAMCLEDADCKGNERCIEEDDGWAECIDPDLCYESTPFPWTSCR